MTPSVKIICGDALEQLRLLPDASVQMAVTSPPYYALRKYNGGSLEIGQEKSPELYVAHLVEIYREMRRVLRDDGTFWLNISDSYSGGGNGGGGSFATHAIHGADKNKAARFGNRRTPAGHKAKDLIGVPWMLAFALKADGWFLRSEITWCKKVPMPESACDRPTSATEKVFLLSKSGDELLWRHRDSRLWAYTEPEPDYVWRDNADDSATETSIAPENWKTIKLPNGKARWSRLNLWRGFDYFYDADAVRNPPSESWANDPRWKNGSNNHNEKNGYESSGAQNPKKLHRMFDKQRGHSRRHAGFNDRWDKMEKSEQCAGGSNMRNFWVLGPEPFLGEHFATFPTAVPKKAILAGSKAGDVVLDPCGGSGTTGKVALELGRSAVLVELNPDYCELIKRRCDVTPGLALA